MSEGALASSWPVIATPRGAHLDVAPEGAQVGANPARVYLSGLAPTGRLTMAGCAEAIARYLSQQALGIDDFPWATVDHARAVAVRGALMAAVSEEQYSPATANKYLYCLRGILRSAWRLGQISTDTYHRAIDIQPVRGARLMAGREVQFDERIRMLDATAGVTPADVRDRALIALAYLSGARRAELVTLAVGDIAFYPPVVRIRGKGNKVRAVPLTDEAVWWVEPWVELRGEEAGPLFCPVARGGHIQRGRQLTGEAVRQIFLRRARVAGIDPPSPHDFRRSYAGDLLDAGNDLPVVSGLMGHASVATTARYDRRGHRAAVKAVQALRLTAPPVPVREVA